MKGMECKTYTYRGIAMIVYMLLMYISLLVLSVIIWADESLYTCLFITVILLLGLLCFYKITITIDKTNLSFKLGIGLIKKSYEIANIKSCKPYTGISKRMGIAGPKISFTGNILEYYIVTGFKAIELRFHDRPKTTVLIGTNQPDEISRYIQSLIDESINALKK